MMEVFAMSKGLRGERSVPAGFTLVEIIVALTVISIALGTFISMFISAMNLAAERRDSLIASELAEIHLNAITTSPTSFTWATDSGNEDGLFSVETAKLQSGVSDIPSSPETTLVLRSAHERNINLYGKFETRAWGRLPAPDANAYEITVAVRWTTNGRPRMFALTSSISRFQVDNFEQEAMDKGVQS